MQFIFWISRNCLMRLWFTCEKTWGRELQCFEGKILFFQDHAFWILRSFLFLNEKILFYFLILCFLDQEYVLYNDILCNIYTQTRLKYWRAFSKVLYLKSYQSHNNAWEVNYFSKEFYIITKGKRKKDEYTPHEYRTWHL